MLIAGVVTVLSLVGITARALPASTLTASDVSSVPVPPAPGQPPHLPASSRALMPLTAATELHLTFALRPADPSALARFALAVSTPGNALYRRYLAPGEFGARFGATATEIASVRSFLASVGLTSGATSANNLSISVDATAGQVATALHTRLLTYRLPSGRIAYANTAAPALPAAASSALQAIIGLNNLAQAHPAKRAPAPAGHTRTPKNVAVAASAKALLSPCAAASNEAATDGGFTADQLASAYRFDRLYSQGLTGAGVTIAMYELEKYGASDIAAYQSCYHTHVPVTNDLVDGGATDPSSGEAVLDIENAIGAAPGASIAVYSAPNGGAGPFDAYQRIVTDDTAKVISSSFGICEAQTDISQARAEQTLFQQAAAQGQDLLSASGDFGAEDCETTQTPHPELSVDDPSSDPFVTAVGGTDLTAVGPSPTETVWNESSTNGGAGGGGISTFFAMPSYQGGHGVLNTYTSSTPCAANAPGGANCRELPDIAATADPANPYVIYYNGSWSGAGGTSGAAPLWAGLLALINQSCPVGFVNPALYQAAADPGGTPAFNDITIGNNDYLDRHNGSYPATPGYDLASGLGTPIADGLLTHLCAAPAVPATFTALSGPTRLLDTRDGTGTGTAGPVAAHATVRLQVAGQHGIPASGVTAVALNVTATDPTSVGFVTVFGDGTPRPLASNLNLARGQTAPNLIMAPVDNGMVDLYNGSDGTVNLIADASGYFVAAPAAAGDFVSLTPNRLLDTRDGTGTVTAQPVAPNGTIQLTVAGRGAVPPTGVSAVVLNITATAATSVGYVTVYADGATRPLASNLNIAPGQTRPNLVIAPVNNGMVDLYNGSTGTVQLIADVAGYFVSGKPAGSGSFGALTPTRLLDTRNPPSVPVGPHSAITLAVNGQAGVPSTGVSAVILNVTETGPTSVGYLTVFPGGSQPPLASNLNFMTGQTAPNLVLAPVGADGTVSFFNGSAGTVHVIADLSGYFVQ